MAQVKLQERIFGGKPQVDRAECVIRHVKLLDKHSRNGRLYTDQALNDAVILYAGAPVMFEHKPASDDRPVLENVGWISNPVREGDAIFGDFNVLSKHEHGDLIFEIAERNPSLMGFSHSAQGEVRLDDGVEVVEQLLSVESLDLVRQGATTRGLFESLETPTQGRAVVKTRIRSVVLAAPKGTPGRQHLLEMLENPVMDMEMEAPAESSSPETQLDDALKAAVMAIVNGEGTVDEKLEKIKALLGMTSSSQETTEEENEESSEESGDSMQEEEGENPAGSEQSKVTEALLKKLNDQSAQIAALQKREREREEAEAVRSLFESFEVKPSGDDLRIARQLNESDRRKFVLGLKKVQESEQAPSVRDSGSGTGQSAGAYPTDHEGFVKSVRG